MTTTIDLPGGHHATLLTADELSNKQAKALRRNGRKVALVAQHLKDLGVDVLRNEDDPEGDPESAEVKAAVEAKNLKSLELLTSLSDEEDDNLDLFARACAAVCLVEWTLDLPLPKTPEDVDNLPRSIYAPLVAAASQIDLNEPSFDMEDAADPKATDDASVASEPPSEEVPS